MAQLPNSDLFVTPLHGRHRDLDARMVPFAGWDMPIQYPQGILAEHRHTRDAASLFDTCHMSEFRVSGAQAAGALDTVFARGTADQKPGTCRYTFLLSSQGTILDDLIVYRLRDDEFFIVGNAGTHDRDKSVISERVGAGAQFDDVSAQTGKLDVQGPASPAVLAQLGMAEAQQPGRFRCRRGQLAEHDVLVSGTGYTGELGFEIYTDAERAADLWDRICESEAIQPAGLGARDTLRLEAGLPLYGHDLDDTITPVEAGFAWVLRPAGREFVGRVALDTKPKKHLVGFELDGRRAAREGSTIFSATGEAIGRVTSGSFGPSVGRAVSLGLVEAEAKPVPGAPCWLGATWERALRASVAELPFYRRT